MSLPIGRRAMAGLLLSAAVGLALAYPTRPVTIVVPAGTPPAVIDRLNAEFNRVLADADVRGQLIARGFEPHAMSVAQWDGFIASETRRRGGLIRAANPEPKSLAGGEAVDSRILVQTSP